MSTLQHKKILIVENESGCRDSMRYCLEKEGVIAIQAKDGFEALKILEAHSFDLITTRSSMPGMTCIDLYREMMSKCIITPILIILRFGNGDAHAVLTKIEDRDILLKPFRADGLKSLIEKVLEDGLENKTMAKPNVYGTLSNCSL